MKRSTLTSLLEHSSEAHRMRMKEKQNQVSNNLKALNERANQLNKPIPDELLAMVYINQPIGSSFLKSMKNGCGMEKDKLNMETVREVFNTLFYGKISPNSEVYTKQKIDMTEINDDRDLSAKSFIPNVNRESKYDEVKAVNNAKIPDCSPNGGCELIESLLESNEYKDDGRSQQEVEKSILRAEIEMYFLKEENERLDEEYARLDERKRDINKRHTRAWESMCNDKWLLKWIYTQKLREDVGNL